MKLYFKYSIFLLILVSIILPSCNANKYLQDNEKFIGKNKIELKDNQLPSKKKSRLEYRLQKLTPKTNGRFLFLFDRAGIYYANKDKDKWYNNYFRKEVGEEPSIYSDKQARQTVKNMKNFLRNNQGFYEAEVEYYTKDSRFSKDIHYVVTPKTRYRIHNLEFIGKDSLIIDKIKNLPIKDPIKKGDPIDEYYFDKYKAEIANHLQNDGYADFSVKNLRYFGDSSFVHKNVDIFMQVIPPDGDSLHHQYYISNINIHTAINHNDPRNIYKKDSLNGIKYTYTTAHHLIEPKTLENFIYLKKGELFSKTAKHETLKKLSSLGPYRFVSVNLSKDTTTQNGINYDLFLTPFAKKWDFELGVDAYYAQLNQSKSKDIQLFGLNFGTEFRNKNLFRGGEKYSISTETGAEFQFQKPYLRTFILGLQNSLEFPRLLNSFGMRTALNKTNILNKEQFEHLKKNTVTRIGLGGNYININNFYDIATIKADYSYVYQYNIFSKFAFRQVGIDINYYDIKSGFKQQVDNNPLLARSFVDNILTGYIFRDLSFFYNDSPLKYNHSNSLYVNFEMSGVETYLLNKLYNVIASNDVEWKINNNLTFAKYFRMEANYRHYREISNGLNLATRVYLSGAIPFSSNQFIPYGKQFYVGGPNSMRGWDQRELGPGGYDPRNEPSSQIFYQQGDIKMEANAEVRFDIISIFEGAIFIDAGNVWTLQNDSKRPGSQFSRNFYNQMAISSGLGLRFDFDFFNIRFDFGYKIRYPYTYDGKRHWATWDNIRSQGLGNLQVAVNYPF